MFDISCSKENISGEPEKVPTFEKFRTSRLLRIFQYFKFNKQPKDQRIFLISLTVLRALEVSINSMLQKSHGYKMSEKGPKALIKSDSCTDQPRKHNCSWTRDIHCSFIAIRLKNFGYLFED